MILQNVAYFISLTTDPESPKYGIKGTFIVENIQIQTNTEQEESKHFIL